MIRKPADLDIVLNINKPIGWSSYDVIRWLKRKVPGVKVGHAGTLDPFATGILLVCMGKATRRVSELMESEKEYRACMTLGTLTDTLDITGKIVERNSIPKLDIETLRKRAQEFVGIIEQIPPAFSAVKVNGKRAYKLARSGQDVELRPRKVEIYKMEIERFNGTDIELSVTCSRGTYMRSLARDLARSLDTVGFLRKLVRTRIGDYSLDKSHRIENLDSSFWHRLVES